MALGRGRVICTSQITSDLFVALELPGCLWGTDAEPFGAEPQLHLSSKPLTIGLGIMGLRGPGWIKDLPYRSRQVRPRVDGALQGVLPAPWWPWGQCTSSEHRI